MEGIASELDEQSLRSRLREVCALRPGTRITVGIASRDLEICLQGRGADVTHAAELPLASGCLTKLLTGAIAIDALQRHGLSTDKVGEHLGLGDCFGPVSLRHLLDHTHGWDTSTANELQVLPDGRVDVENIHRRLRESGRFAAPGEMHFYANASAWLAAALAERIEGAPLAELLIGRLFSGREIAETAWYVRRESASGAVCGATGSGMQVSGAALLAFLKSFWRGHRRAEALSTSAHSICALPGWSGLERGILWGWKCYDDGWFGHSSSAAGSYGLVRVQPERHVAIFVCSPQNNCAPVATALLGRWFTTFAPMRGPRLLSLASDLDASAYLGTYEIAATRVVIERAQSGLSMRAHQRAGEQGIAKEPFHVAALRPASDHLFYPDPMHAELFPYLQFGATHGGSFAYIWNGKTLWLRRQKR